MKATIELAEECGGETTLEISGATSAEIEAQARRTLIDWVREGEYGPNGAIVSARWTLLAIDGTPVETPQDRWMDVEIEPDHARLIRDAARAANAVDRLCGTDPESHDWTSDGEGGCRENPGVWSHGGTTMSFAQHCRRCGLHRVKVCYGAQRNPGQADEVEYRMLEPGECGWL